MTKGDQVEFTYWANERSTLPTLKIKAIGKYIGTNNLFHVIRVKNVYYLLEKDLC